jgi:hypothetical protein
MQEADRFLKSNGSAVFEGDAVTFLTTVYRDETLPLPLRFNAALAVAPFERPRMSEARVAVLELRAKEASEEERQRQIDEGDRRLEELIRQFDRFVADRENELQDLITAGELSALTAEKIRSWWIQPELPALPPPETPEGKL